MTSCEAHVAVRSDDRQDRRRGVRHRGHRQVRHQVADHQDRRRGAGQIRQDVGRRVRPDHQDAVHQGRQDDHQDHQRHLDAYQDAHQRHRDACRDAHQRHRARDAHQDDQREVVESDDQTATSVSEGAAESDDRKGHQVETARRRDEMAVRRDQAAQPDAAARQESAVHLRSREMNRHLVATVAQRAEPQVHRQPSMRPVQ